MRLRLFALLALLVLAIAVSAQLAVQPGLMFAPVEQPAIEPFGLPAAGNQPAAGVAATPQQMMVMQRITSAMWRAANQPTLMTAGARYAYCLHNGVLAQYDGDVLKPARSLELYGPLPATPTADAPLADRIKYGLEVVKRSDTPTVQISADDLVVATNNTVFDVNATTLKLISTTNIALPEQANAQDNPAVTMNMAVGMPGQMMQFTGGGQTGPQLQVVGRTAYVLLAGTGLVIVDLDHGKLLSRGKLPDNIASVSPAAMNALFQKDMNQGFLFRGNPGLPVGGGGPVDVQKPVTLIGTIHHMDLEGGFWAFDERNGQKYSLTGDKLKELIATPNIEGARVRLTGTTSNKPGIAQYGNGAFTVTDFQVMGVAK